MNIVRGRKCYGIRNIDKKETEKKNNYKKLLSGGSWLFGCGKGLVFVVIISK